MQLSVFEPHRGLSLREAVHRFFDEGVVAGERTSFMPVDVIETQEAIVVTATLPGVSKEDIQVNYEKEILTIKAEVKPVGPPENARVLLRERVQGSYNRTFRLPFAVDSEAAHAEYKDGLLTLTLPKLESARPRQISVN